MKKDLTIIGIGFSAGGISVLLDMFPLIPKDINAAIVLVSHLPAAYDSKLDEIVGRYTDLPVIRASDGLVLACRTVYVLPENQMMTVSNGRLRLRRREGGEIANYAIDIFLTSLAEESGRSAISVILSGAGQDGLEGSKAIRIHGGTVIAQDPFSAQFSEMPKSLIAQDCQHYALLPHAIANKLFEKANHS